MTISLAVNMIYLLFLLCLTVETVFTDEAPGFEGIFYDKANPMITELLEEKGALLKLDFFTHSYPHDWRTKNQLSTVQRHNGLLQSLNSVKIF